MTVPFIGYADRFSTRPGGRLAVKVSSALGGTYQADLVRVRHSDPNPDGPGIRYLPVPSNFTRRAFTAWKKPTSSFTSMAWSCGMAMAKVLLRAVTSLM